ncbi:M56 family metallopeptidase [Danxiaibacter flavus]|uniref:M56 family metallopeptidase n=1 Tax=Danxiaibacter flavus TaxID=3049108 RepID=A0ABV3ZC29_9BACT|nr:M56 family metallopeptidase [Chitinophagaceae bacterium DXS]
MLTLSHSAFLQALGYAIVNSLWQMALLWIVVVLLNSLFSFSSNARYKLALTAQFAGFAWFLFTLQFYFSKCLQSIQEMKGIDINAQKALITQQTAENFNTKVWSALIHMEQTLPYLSVAYILLLFVLGFRWIRSYRYTLEIKKNGLMGIDDIWSDFVNDMVTHLNIKNKVSIFASTIVNSPLTIGFWKPVILIPIASVNHLTVQQLEAVILHELAHIRRMDYLLNIVLSIIEISLFFNPFTQLISRFIKKEREHSCDDWVLQFKYNPAMYAEALLQLAYLNTSRSTLAMPAKGNKGDLLSRVKRMLNQKEQTFTYRHQIVAFVLMTSILSSIAWLSPIKAGPPMATGTSTKTIIVEPVTAKVDNPLFNPVFFLNEPMKKEITYKVEESAKQGVQEAMKGLVEAKKAVEKVAPLVLTSLQASNEAINLISPKDISNQIVIATDVIKNAQIPVTFAYNADSIQRVVNKELAKVKFEWSKDKLDEQVAKAKIEMSKVAALQWLSADKQATIQKSMDEAIKQLEELNLQFNLNENQNASESPKDRSRARRMQSATPPPPPAPRPLRNENKTQTDNSDNVSFNFNYSPYLFDSQYDTLYNWNSNDTWEDYKVAKNRYDSWNEEYPVNEHKAFINVRNSNNTTAVLPAVCKVVINRDDKKETLQLNKVKMAKLIHVMYVLNEQRRISADAPGAQAVPAACPEPKRPAKILTIGVF